MFNQGSVSLKTLPIIPNNMCVIIIKKQGKKMPKSIAKSSARINPDGLGIMWLDTYEVTYHKSSEYSNLYTDRPFIAHFRYATIGSISVENTHPFQCGNNKNEWLMMNGTIDGLGDNVMSDTRVLANQLGYIVIHYFKSLRSTLYISYPPIANKVSIAWRSVIFST